MRNYLVLGPVRVKLSSRHLARWGYPRLSIGGLSLLTRDSGGRLLLASYHPRGSLTWHWFLAFYRSGGRAGWFNNQWRKGYGAKGLTFCGWTLCLTEQGYHREGR